MRPVSFGEGFYFKPIRYLYKEYTDFGNFLIVANEMNHMGNNQKSGLLFPLSKVLKCYFDLGYKFVLCLR